jgi:hypothetical protein
MSRSNNNAPSLDEPAGDVQSDAFRSWLDDPSSGVDGAPSRVVESGERPIERPSGATIGSRAADSVDEREVLAVAAMRGHSPSARALVNAGDLVLSVAESAVPPQPAPAAPTLKDRILRTAAITARSKVAPEMPIVSAPNEAVGVIHKKSEDPRRLQLIDALGARGAAISGARELRTDRALAQLLEQLWPFLGFDVVFVSAVAGPDTIHRVHRGFPAAMGKMDVVPRELSFCTHTVSAREPLVVEDAGTEAFFRRSLLVQKFGARSYLGVPLFSRVAGEEVALGALCGISLTPRKISQEDVDLTSCFARIAEALVTHDDGKLASLIAQSPSSEPEGGDPAAAKAEPAVYSSEQFQSFVAAERARGGATKLLRADEEAWARLSSFVVPNAIVTGELAGAFRGLLIPKLARFEPDVEAALAALEAEEL